MIKIKADLEKRDALISKKQSECDSAKVRIDSLQKSLDEAGTKLSKLLAGGMAFSPAIETWEEAMVDCDGDYAKARSTYPDAYRMRREQDQQNRNTKGK